MKLDRRKLKEQIHELYRSEQEARGAQATTGFRLVMKGIGSTNGGSRQNVAAIAMCRRTDSRTVGVGLSNTAGGARLPRNAQET
jgi:hypothetical protein